MFSGLIGKNEYPELRDLRHTGTGCHYCQNWVEYNNEGRELLPSEMFEKYCQYCKIYDIIKLTKRYAEKIDNYERLFEND